MNKSTIQFLMAQNKTVIRHIEDNIAHYRLVKTSADEKGFLNEEYDAHNALKYLRGEMKKYVSAQKQLKKLMKEI